MQRVVLAFAAGPFSKLGLMVMDDHFGTKAVVGRDQNGRNYSRPCSLAGPVFLADRPVIDTLFFRLLQF